jgi:hypothetical protein
MELATVVTLKPLGYNHAEEAAVRINCFFTANIVFEHPAALVDGLIYIYTIYIYIYIHTHTQIKRRLNSGNACYHSVQNFLSSRLLYKNIKIRIHKTIILPVVLYGCETWSLILREEHRLRVFENRVLRRIFDQKRDDVTGDWRKLHN